MNVIRVNFGAAVDDEPFEPVSTADSGDDLLTSKECAALIGVTPSTWRSLVQQGYAPRADEVVTSSLHRWYRSTVEEFAANRPGRTGRPRKSAG